MNDYAKSLEQNNKIKLLEPLKNVKQHHKMQCLVCKHEWSATPLSKQQTFKKYGVGGCPVCNKQRKHTTYDISRQKTLERLKVRGIVVLTDWYDGRHTSEKIKVTNTRCGHTFWISANNLIQAEVDCSVCGPQKRIAPLTAWSKENSRKWKETASEWQLYKAEVTSQTEQTYKKYKKYINPENLPRGKAGVDGAYHLDHIVPKRFCFENDVPVSACSDKSNLQMIGWRENVGSRNHIKGTIPPLFFQYIPSYDRIKRYVETIQTFLPNSQSFVSIADIIVTLYNQTTNRAIIIVPIDQIHANQKNGYNAYKTLMALGINTTIIFEDELFNTKLIQAKLRHYTNQNQNLERIHSRACIIRECSKEEKKVLLDTNHLQGNDIAQFNYGAYFNGQLVAVMTFSRPRVALGQKGKKDREGQWELSRFCTDVNFRIPGIASRLLKYFQRHHPNWVEIYSYADKRWSKGNMYYQLGFELVIDNPPDYFYVIEGVRKHRWNYRKDILKNTLPNYDVKLTEYQNMTNHGYYRVWDCGTLKFSMKNNTQF